MSAQPYSIHTDVKFPPLRLIDVRRLQQETKEQWSNRARSTTRSC